MKLFEFVDGRGLGVLTEWYWDTLEKPQRAAITAKIKAVITAGEPGDLRQGELPPNMFRGPVRHAGKSYPNTYKFTVNGPVKLRPLACRGPIDPDDEWTILVPVIEVGNQYPGGCFEQAEARRLEVIADPENRRREITRDGIQRRVSR